MLNWKNVQYADGSGLVNAIRGNNAQINDNNKQVVDSISQFGDDYSKTQTDAAIARLAGSTDPQQAQDILRSYAQGGNGFVDQGALADSYRDQTKEFRAAESHSDSLLTNAATRAESEIKTSAEYRQHRINELAFKEKELANKVAITDLEHKRLKMQVDLEGSIFGTTGDLTSNPNATQELRNYGSLSRLPTNLQGAAQSKFDASNLEILKGQFPALEAGSTNAEWYARRKDINKALLSSGMSQTNADRLQTNLYGQYGRQLNTPDAVKTLDDRAALRTEVDTTPNNILRYSDTEVTDAFGTVEGTKKVERAVENLYNSTYSELAKENVAFNPSDPSNIFAPASTLNRNNNAKYAAFVEKIADYPESVRNTLTNRYVADNKLDKKVVSTLDSARTADQNNAVRIATSIVQKSTFDGSPESIRKVMSDLNGIPSEQLLGVQDLLVGHLAKNLDKHTFNTNVGGMNVTTNFQEAAKTILGADLKHVDEATVALNSALIDNFGERLNTLIDNAIPGANSTIKGRLSEELSVRYQIPQLQDKIVTAKERLRYKSKYYDTPNFTNRSFVNEHALLNSYSGDDAYNGDEGPQLLGQARSFVDAAINKMKEEKLMTKSDILPWRVKQLAYKAFSTVFTPDDEGLEEDDWVSSKGWLGDDEISISGSLENGYSVDFSDKGNNRGYKKFQKELTRALQAVKDDRNNYVDSKLKTKK